MVIPANPGDVAGPANRSYLCFGSSEFLSASRCLPLESNARIRLFSCPWVRIYGVLFELEFIEPFAPKLVSEVNFKNPPVVEVACSIHFSTPPERPIRAGHIGLYWQTVHDGFPELQEQPPIPPILEPPSGQPASHQINIQFGGQIPRAVLVSPGGRNLIQIQNDRFIYNWKSVPADPVYPRYEKIFSEFSLHFTGFRTFLKKNDLGDPSYKQFELSYVNHVGPNSGLKVVGENGVLVDHIRSTVGKRFLPAPEGFNWITSYPLPENSGRLHIAAQTVYVPPSMERNVRIAITARGISSDVSEAGKDAWFNTAHEWVTKAFADSTAEVLQKTVWERIP
jgi:uncharacterized protein (TIGR04255 family)